MAQERSIYSFEIQHYFHGALFKIEGVGDFLARFGFTPEMKGNKVALPTNPDVLNGFRAVGLDSCCLLTSTLTIEDYDDGRCGEKAKYYEVSR